MMKHKSFYSIAGAAVLLAAGIQYASAHAVVTPNQAGVAQFINFSLGVPSERPIATVEVRLLMPSGLMEVTPFVKPGWKMAVKKNGDAVTEIDWSGGSIPAGEKDQFLFSAQVPPTATTLQWKAYQTYADGSVVSWDQSPNPSSSMSEMDNLKSGPYSMTHVIDDVNSPNTGAAGGGSSDLEATKVDISLVISLIAAVIAVLAFTKKRA